MRFFIVDDSASIRVMLSDIIREEGLGIIAGEADDGSEVYVDVLKQQEIDIILIDLLMPNRSGIDTIKEISSHFSGKIIMISQVESKDMIGKAYELGIEYYIMKPINRLEVVSIIKKTINNLVFERAICDMQKSLGLIKTLHEPQELNAKTYNAPIIESAKKLLLDLGIIAESGKKDILDIIYFFYIEAQNGEKGLPQLKQLYESIARKRLTEGATPEEVTKEVKAGEQRIRRAIQQAITNIAAIGLTDYTHPKFEKYATSFFDYNQVRVKMMELEEKVTESQLHSQINIRKFITALYYAAIQEMDGYN